MKNRILLTIIVCFFTTKAVCTLPDFQDDFYKEISNCSDEQLEKYYNSLFEDSYDGLFDDHSSNLFGCYDDFGWYSSFYFDFLEEYSLEGMILRGNIYDEDKECYVCPDCGSQIWGGADTPCAVCKAAIGMPIGNFPAIMLLVVLLYVAIIVARGIERKTIFLQHDSTKSDTNSIESSSR